MRHSSPLRLASILCLALACSGADEAAEPAAPDAAGAAPAQAAAASASAPVVYAGNDYLCPDGKTFNARLDKGSVRITADGQTVTLAHDSASFGARYEGEGTLFVARGNEAVLAREGGAPQTCKAQ